MKKTHPWLLSVLLTFTLLLQACTTAQPNIPACKFVIGRHPRGKVTSPTDRIHTVSSGETFNSIAVQYGVPVDDILRANSLRNYALGIGWNLVIPASSHPQTDGTTQTNSVASRLMNLKALRDSGSITESEYESQSKILIDQL